MENLKWYDKLWNWLNGNKTIFGMFLLAVVAPNLPDDLTLVYIPVKTAVEWIGGLLTGAGVIHKIYKSNTEPGPNQ
jgi:hypothetical protein